MQVVVRQFAFVVALSLLVVPVPPAGADRHPVAFGRYQVAVAGGMALGYLAYPTDMVPTTLLVVAHGCCVALGAWSASVANTSYRLSAWAADFGVAVVGMDYTGKGHWDVAAGARDTIAATVDLHARWNLTRTILWGASMGGEVSGMALAQRPELYDYWVDEFGVTDLPEEFAVVGSAGMGPPSAAHPTGTGSSWILDETGGPPGVSPPEAWTSRSPALLAASMHGLRHAYLVHGAADPVVPESQGWEMHDALVHAGIPVTLRIATSGADAADGGVQGPYVPEVGAPVVPTPEGHTLGAHNYIGAVEALAILGQLLGGREPDAGVPDTIDVVDYHACWAVGQPQDRWLGLPCRVDVHP